MMKILRYSAAMLSALMQLGEFKHAEEQAQYCALTMVIIAAIVAIKKEN